MCSKRFLKSGAEADKSLLYNNCYRKFDLKQLIERVIFLQLLFYAYINLIFSSFFSEAYERIDEYFILKITLLSMSFVLSLICMNTTFSI